MSISFNIFVINLEMPQYLQLYPPALDWILQCIAQKSPEVRKICTPIDLYPRDVFPYTQDRHLTILHLHLILLKPASVDNAIQEFSLA